MSKYRHSKTGTQRCSRVEQVAVVSSGVRPRDGPGRYSNRTTIESGPKKCCTTVLRSTSAWLAGRAPVSLRVARAPSGPGRLDDAERRVRRDDPLQPEPRRLQQLPILLLGALPPPEDAQHVQVHRLRWARPIVRRDDHLDQQQLARRSQGAMAVAQQ